MDYPITIDQFIKWIDRSRVIINGSDTAIWRVFLSSAASLNPKKAYSQILFSHVDPIAIVSRGKGVKLLPLASHIHWLLLTEEEEEYNFSWGRVAAPSYIDADLIAGLYANYISM